MKILGPVFPPKRIGILRPAWKFKANNKRKTQRMLIPAQCCVRVGRVLGDASSFISRKPVLGGLRDELNRARDKFFYEISSVQAI
jgi:hypothetical protein